MNMKRCTLRYSLVLGSAVFLSSFMSASADAPIESNPRGTLAQAAALVIGTRLVWKNLQNPRQRDMLYEPISCKDMVYENESLNLIFTRAGRLAYGISDLINLSVVEDAVRTVLSFKFFKEVGSEPSEEDVDDYEAAFDAWESAAGAVATNAQTYASAIIECIEQITFQEHRLGAVGYKEWVYDQLCFSARTWVGVAERNYWLDDAYRKKFATTAQYLFPSNDGTFNLSDFVTMNWGIGDTHLKCGWITPLGRGFELKTGVTAIVPTATETRRVTDRQLMPLTLDDFQGYGRARLNEVFIAPKLGNGGHFGGGLWSDVVWSQKFFHDQHQLKIKAHAGVDYLIPGAEERLFMQYPTITIASASAANDLMASFLNGTDDAQFRAFIGQYILPEPAMVVVAPGAIVQLGVTMQYNFGQALFFAGYDWYYKSTEKITQIIMPSDVATFFPAQIDLALVGGRIQGANLSSSNQQKVFGGVSYNALHRDVSLFSKQFSQLGVSYGLHGAVATAASGLGDDFSIGLSFGVKC